jgi:pimeloyl-ACP methyl ester carboxylesterase
MIITEVGNHPAVRSLVYVAAFAPQIGETAGGLQSKTPPASTSIVPAGGGFVQVKPESFPAKTTVAAWSQKPSYAIVAQQDREINPDLERFMSRRAKSETFELPGIHAIFLSHPKEVAALIEKAAKAVN